MKFFKILCLILIISFSSNNSYAARYGTGELKLTDSVVRYFIQYIRGKQFKYPGKFYVAIDGTDYLYWYCSEMTNCEGGSISQDLAECFRITGIECKKFARKRTIKWENGINPGKGKESTIKSKWSEAEIREKLTKLGFIK